MRAFDASTHAVVAPALKARSSTGIPRRIVGCWDVSELARLAVLERLLHFVGWAFQSIQWKLAARCRRADASDALQWVLERLPWSRSDLVGRALPLKLRMESAAFGAGKAQEKGAPSGAPGEEEDSAQAQHGDSAAKHGVDESTRCRPFNDRLGV